MLGSPFIEDESAINAAPAEWFEQRLTHFDDAKLETSKQRYFSVLNKRLP